MDTIDGVVEYYEPKEIITFVTKLHLEIKGVEKHSNDKFTIKVLEPSDFNIVSSSTLRQKPVDYNKYDRMYDKKTPLEITELAEDLVFNLAHVINKLTGLHYYGETLELFDGLDCVGFDNILIGNGYSVQIYSNPDIDGDDIRAAGFGFDLYLDNKLIVDGHFDGSFKSWENDFKDYKYKNLFEK